MKKLTNNRGFSMLFGESLTENNGRASSIRINSFVALITSIVIAGYAIGKDKAEIAFPFFIAYLIAAFVPKAIQKFAENMGKKKPFAK